MVIFYAIFDNSEFSSWHFEIVQTLKFLRFLTRDAFLLHYFDTPLCIDLQDYAPLHSVRTHNDP